MTYLPFKLNLACEILVVIKSYWIFEYLFYERSSVRVWYYHSNYELAKFMTNERKRERSKRKKVLFKVLLWKYKGSSEKNVSYIVEIQQTTEFTYWMGISNH